MPPSWRTHAPLFSLPLAASLAFPLLGCQPCQMVEAEYEVSGSVSFDDHVEGPIELRFVEEESVDCTGRYGGAAVSTPGWTLDELELEGPGAFETTLVTSSPEGEAPSDVMVLAVNNPDAEWSSCDGGLATRISPEDHDDLSLEMVSGYCPLLK